MSRPGLEPEAIRAAMMDFGKEARPRPDCPPPDAIWQAVQGALPPTETEGLLEHVATCPVCTEAWDLTRDLADAMEPTAEAPGISVIRGGSRQAWVGAAAVLLVALGWPFLSRISPYITRGARVEITEAVARETLPRNECLLAWRGPREAETYVLELSWVLAERFGELPAIEPIAARQGKMSYLVAPELLTEVPPGARLLWSLTALKGDAVVAENAFSVLLD